MVAFFSGLGERHKQCSANHAGVAEGRQTAWRRFQALMSKLSWTVLGRRGGDSSVLVSIPSISDQNGCRDSNRLPHEVKAFVGEGVLGRHQPAVAASFRRGGLPPTRM